MARLLARLIIALLTIFLARMTPSLAEAEHTHQDIGVGEAPIPETAEDSIL